MNRDIIDNLSRHQKESQLKRDRFRAAAYGKAIQQIRSLNYKITDVSQVRGMPGIGPKISEKIDLVLKGRPKEAHLDPLYENLLKIAGIGPKTADYLVNIAKIKSMDELRRKQHLLDDKQRIGLKYYQYSGFRIPRQEMKIHDDILQHAKNELVALSQNPEFRRYKRGFDSLRIDVVGSYRRGYSDSGDIDVILTSTNPRVFYCFIELLRSVGYILDTLSQGDKLFTGYAKIEGSVPRRIDIIYTTPEEYEFALLYFTGPKAFNTDLRLAARNMGLILNRYGLFRGGYRIPGLHSEKEIIEYLGFRYLPPDKRELQV